MGNWFLIMKGADFKEWSKRYGISPVVARLIRNRDVLEKDIDKFLNGTMEDCYSPFLLKDMDRAVSILREKIEDGSSIRIIGDYDVDGVCATSILWKGLSALGAKVDYAIPDRVRDGYGLNERLVEDAYRDGIDTVLTCDNGISALSQIRRASELNMTVIITDHHEVPFSVTEEGREERIPCADAVIDPKQSACTYPCEGICGAVVAYKLMQALFGNRKETEEKLFEEMLQYAAMATVCDVMELKDENRIFVREGLSLIRNHPSTGLLALIQVNGIDPLHLDVHHLGFVLGPCINATGRLDSARRAVELLITEDRRKAVTIAEELKELNEDRQLLTQKGVDEAVRRIGEEQLDEKKVLVLYLPDCHESIAGIIAGRIREKYDRPVFVLTDSKDCVKGSGRSVEGYNMFGALNQCEEYLLKYGGHKMAAGLSMKRENIEIFSEKMNENCEMSIEDMAEKVHLDMELPLQYVTLDLAKELSVLEPFGVGNRKPLFVQRNLSVTGLYRMGKNKEYLKLFLKDDAGRNYQMPYFGDPEKLLDVLREKSDRDTVDRLFERRGSVLLNCAYQVGVQVYRGQEQLNLILEDYC